MTLSRFAVFLVLAGLAALTVAGRGFAQEPAETAAAAATTAAASVTLVDGVPTTSTPLRSLRAFDDKIVALMKRENIPGGALAIVENGRLIYARGYGYADRDKKIPVQPTSLFRLASVSKPITAVAVMRLVQDARHHLDLNTKVFPLLGLKPFRKPDEQAPVDARLNDITVRHLLEHSAGWDRDKSGDIMFKHFQVAQDMKIASPPDHASLIRWALGQPLDFDPGTRHAYSNFGYCVLGRVIEKATGLPYETYVQKHVLAPMGITRMQVGKGRQSERANDEVCYYDRENRTARSVFTGEGDVPLPYAFASPQTMDAHGGWIASVVDMARFAAYLDGARSSSFLRPESLTDMYARPPAPLGRDPDGSLSAAYYALGWMVRPVGSDGKANYWHGGGMPGTSTILVRLAGGRSWVLLLNQRTDSNIDTLLHQAAAEVTRWPKHNLFRQYP